MSFVGMLIALALLAPNLLLAFWPPRDAFPDVSGRFLLLAERVGQVSCLVLAAISWDNGSITNGWLIPTWFCIAVYGVLWGRFLGDGRLVRDLYAPLWRIPIPMAIFPTIAFFGLALRDGSWLLIIATIVLAVGHLPMSIRVARALGIQS